MKGIFLVLSSRRTYIEGVEDGESVGHCLERVSSTSLDASDCYVLCNGKLVKDSDLVQCGQTYHVVPRLIGGKGGFGSMLRAIGAQIEKTTNREACRDLSGRRMRDVNNEKKLREWVSKQTEREKEKEQRRKERWERMRAVPKHKFEDPEYHAQKQKVLENMEESLQVGLQKALNPNEPSTSTAGSSALGKRKAPPSAAAGSAKRSMNWIGVDLEGASDLSSDDSEDEGNSQSSFGFETPCAGEESGASCSGSSENQDEGSSQSGEGSGNSEMPQKLPQETVSNPDSHLEQGDSTSCDAKPLISSSPTEEASKSNSIDDEDVSMTDSNKQGNENSEAQKSSEQRSGLLSALAQVPPKEEVKQEKKEIVEHQELDLMSFESIEDLEAQGLDVLKADLQLRGLKCGGTLTQRAERLWSVRGLTPDQYPANVKAKPAKK